MEPDKLLSLQNSLYSILSHSQTLKVGLGSPPWSREVFNKAIKFALMLSDGKQNVIKDQSELTDWLDKYSFYKQGRN